MPDIADMPGVPNLFLHGGPGLSCGAERARYGAQLPIHWWDQPRGVVMFAHPFGELVEMATDTVSECAQQCGQPVGLVAHSFGAQLALHVASRIPEQLYAVTLLAPVFDIVDALARVARCVLERRADAAGLQRALRLLAQQPSSRDGFWLLVDELMATPDFLRVYFSDEAANEYAAFVDLMSREPLMDAAAFRALVQDSWDLPTIHGSIALACPVDLVFGKYDVLSNSSDEEAVWLRYFTHARSRHLDAGHFIHLERAPDEWWPRANRASLSNPRAS